MKFKINNYALGTMQFIADIDCVKSASTSLKIGLAVKWAFKTEVNLCGANLYRADLYRADLSEAKLSGANLSGANLFGANLSGANLSWTNLSGANLSGANLSGAKLYKTELFGVDMCGADLSRTDLSRANLSGAKLFRASLGEDNKGHLITARMPLIMLEGLKYKIIIFDRHIQVGCEIHTIRDWNTFTEDDITAFDTEASARLCLKLRPSIIKLARASGRR